MAHIKPLKELGKNDASIAGGKGASLGEMTSAGIPVPPGFVVISSAFDRFVEETGMEAEIDAILGKVNYEEMHTIENASEKIQALILGAEMPHDLASEIIGHFKKLGAKFVAVRSSATSEDSASAAWAGQLDSFLNTTSETLIENVKKCWASLFTPRAIFYRKEKNLHNQKISVAVVVQKMVESESSGIAFSVHPVTQSENQAIIEAGFGLGEAIVSGQTTPDSYVIEKEPRRIIDKNVHVQSRGLYRRAEGGNEWRTLPASEGERQVLSDDEILELTELVLRIERHYGFPCDIEWAREKGRFYIVQSRPITTLIGKVDVNKGQIPDFFRSLRRFATRPMTLQRDECGAMMIWHHKARTVIIPVDAQNRAAYIETNDAERAYTEMLDTFRKAGKWKNHITSYDSSCSKMLKASGDASRCGSKSDKELSKAYKLWLEAFDGFSPYLFAPFAIEAKADPLCRKLLAEELGAESEDAFAVISTPSELNEFQKMRLEMIDAVVAGKNNATKHKELADKYGWYNEYSWVEPFFGPEHFAAEMAKITKPEGIKERDRMKSDAENNRKAFAALMKKLKREETKTLAESIHTYTFLRTDRIEKMKRAQADIRPLYDAIGRSLGKKTGQEWTRQMVVSCLNQELIYFLEHGTVPDICSIRKRTTQQYVYYLPDGKPRLIEDESLVRQACDIIHQGESGSDQIKGTIAFGGKAAGRVALVNNKKDLAKVKPGDVLVAKITMPDYTQAMHIACAFVTEEGGVTSHAAIIARELKKPCIVGTGNCTRLLKDGDMVEVDADAGVVRIIDSQPPQTEFISFRKRKIPLFTPAIYYFTPYSEERVGFDLGTGLMVIEGDTQQMLFSKKEFEQAGEYLLDQTIKDPPHLKKRLAEGAKIAERWIKFCKMKLAPEKLKRCTDKEICSLLTEFIQLYENYSCINVPPWMYMGDKLFQHIKAEINLPDDKILILTTPNAATYTREFEEMLLDIALKCKERVAAGESIESAIADKKISRSIDILSEKYFWIPFDYLGPEVWDRAHIIGELKKNLSLSIEEIKSKIKSIKSYPVSLLNSQKALIKEHRLTKDQTDLLEAIKDVATLQDDKKAATTQAHYYLGNLMGEIARRAGIQKSPTYFLLEHEIKEILLNKQDFSEEVELRMKLSVGKVTSRTINVYSGKKAHDLLRFHGLKLPSESDAGEGKNLQGQTGAPGKYTGAAKVLLSPKESSKLNQGDILVASMTTPDYVPLMKKAGAIVTDEGGITCHAAIVSRELGIPCVIGTGNATRVIKDGDTVEVDAENGLVKILARSSSDSNIGLALKYLDLIGGSRLSPPLNNCSTFSLGSEFNTKRYFKDWYDDKVNFHVLILMKEGLWQMWVPEDAHKASSVYGFKESLTDSSAFRRRHDLLAQNIKKIDEIYSLYTYEEISKSDYTSLLELTDKIMDLVWGANAAVFYSIAFDKEICESILKESKTKISSDRFDMVWEKSVIPSFESFDKQQAMDVLGELSKKPDLAAISEKCQYILTDYHSAKTLKLVEAEIKKRYAELIADPKKITGWVNETSKKTRHEREAFEQWLNTLTKDERTLARFIQDVMEIRDRRKNFFAKGLTIIYRIAERMFSEAGLSRDLIPYYTVRELIKGSDYLEANKENVKQRVKGFQYIIPYDGQIEMKNCLIEDAVELMNKNFTGSGTGEGTKEIKGQSGSGGRTTGHARIVINVHSNHGFQKGEILVTGMTRPEFVPLMKLAAGIVTDEGGITCHAAIVSRELGIPCVIGTRTASRTIKDGDMVEVDADKGFVRIIQSGQRSTRNPFSAKNPDVKLADQFIKLIGDQELFPPMHNSAIFIQASRWNAEQSFGKYYADKTLYPILITQKSGQGIMYLPFTKAKNLVCEVFEEYWNDTKNWKKRMEQYRAKAETAREIYDQLTHGFIEKTKFEDLTPSIESIRTAVWDLNALAFFTIYLDKELCITLLKKSGSKITPDRLDTIWETATTPMGDSFDKRRLLNILDLLDKKKTWAEIAETCQYYEAYYHKILPLSEAEPILKERYGRYSSPSERAAARSDIKKEKDKLVSQHDAFLATLTTEEKKLVTYLQTVIELRDDRKDFISMLLTSAYRVAEKLFTDAGVSHKLIFFCCLDEMILGKEYLLANRKALEDRQAGCTVLVDHDGKMYIEQGSSETAKRMESFFLEREKRHTGDEIKGQAGSPGKATGRARIIQNIETEGKTFRHGEILVTGMTRPEFVPLMKLAAGIVTDEGGITCHAAIVSRELGIPCVIGTRTASRTIKDGDMVEVDAEKGVVRILDREGIERDTEGLIERYGLKPATQRDLPLFTLSCIGEAYTRLTKPLIWMSYHAVGGIGSRGHFHTLLNEQQVADDLNAVLNDETKDIERDILGPLTAKSRESEKRIAKTRPLAENSPLDNLQKLADEYLTYLACLGSYNCFYRLIGDGKRQTRLTETQIVEIGKERDRLAKIYPELEKSFALATRKIGESHGYDGDLLRYLTYDELRSKTDYHLSPTELSELTARREGYFYMIDSATGKEQVLTDPAMIRGIKSRHFTSDMKGIDTLHGTTGHGGKATGLAIVSINRSGKGLAIADGQTILVTPMTHPEDLPLIKRIAAIVTDEGGILSHAAIIARELNKPCIIGTKNATQAIKDGDMVEVDADNGIVRILKESTIDLEEAKQLSWTEWLERPYHPFMTTLNYKGVDQRYFEAVGLKGFGYTSNLYQYPMIFKSEKLVKSNRSALDSFMKTNTIFDLTKLLERAHDKNLKEIQKINSSKLPPTEKLASLRELACTYFPFLWIIEPLESYYTEKTDSIVPKHIQGDVKKWVGDVSIPKKKNVYALMQESLKRDPIERVHKEFAWLKSRDGFTDFYTIKELEEIKGQSKEECSTEVNIPKPLSGLAEEIKELTYFRTDRTDKYYEFLGLCRQIFMEVASAIGVPFKELANYDVDSILAGKPKKIDIPYTFLYYKGRQIVMKERLIEVRSRNTSEVKGLIAFPGIAWGIARIVKHPTEISKLSRGEILVAQMTFPSFIAAMQKAAAFVTDEGGITCHAAIIAREMRKPCIVGTGNCTKALNDGDMVEVDADKGIVRVISRNESSDKPESRLRSSSFIRMFEATGMPLLTTSIAMEHYKPLGAVAVFRDNIWTAYLPKTSERLALQQGLELFGSKMLFTEFRRAFEEYMKSSSLLFKQTLSQKKITISDAEKFLSLISEHWKHYMKTESFFVDEAFNKSKEDKVIAANLQEFERIKTAGRHHLNSIIFGSDSQLSKLISMISEQTGVPVTELLNYSKDELLGAMSGKRVSKEILRQRAESYAVLNAGGGYSILEGEQAKRFIAGFITEQMSGEMRGTVANKGKATGRAKILFYGPDTFDKIPEMIRSMEKGSILITETTSPEILPACKKSSAILTNQGGMLSHAAIVSRELGIPCIVGLENITHRVKDGDLVEVDADSGLVRIIQPSKK